MEEVEVDPLDVQPLEAVGNIGDNYVVGEVVLGAAVARACVGVPTLGGDDGFIEGMEAAEAGSELTLAGAVPVLLPESIAVGGIEAVASRFEVRGDEAVGVRAFEGRSETARAAAELGYRISVLGRVVIFMAGRPSECQCNGRQTQRPLGR